MKECGKCKRLLDYSCFYMRRYKNGTVSPMSACKECNKKKVYDWRIKNPEKFKAHSQKHCKSTVRKETRKIWVANNLEKLRERDRRRAGQRKEYLKQHPEKNKKYNDTRNYKRRALNKNISPLNGNEREYLREYMGDLCFYCGQKKPETLDHLLPLTRGGDNSIENLVLACRPCNSQKNNKTPQEYYEFLSKMDEKK